MALAEDEGVFSPRFSSATSKLTHHWIRHFDLHGGRLSACNAAIGEEEFSHAVFPYWPLLVDLLLYRLWQRQVAVAKARNARTTSNLVGALSNQRDREVARHLSRVCLYSSKIWMETKTGRSAKHDVFHSTKTYTS